MEWLRTGGETLVALAAMLLIAEQAPATVIRSMVLASGQAATWSGRFGYEFSDGENVAGTAVVVTYELTVTPTSCTFSAEGYQTEETILCTVRTVANGIEVRFRSYGNGAVADKYGNNDYSVGDPLFALERRGGKLLTHWKGYSLPDGKAHRVGVYFRRLD